MKTIAKKETVLTQALKSTKLPDSQTVKLYTAAYELGSRGYNYAIMKPGHLDFPCLQIYANQYRLPMLVQLRMGNPFGSIKHHIIGIVPVAIGNEIQMNIVERCCPERKTIPLDEENMSWCSGDCASCSVDQLVAFVQGNNAVKKLQQHKSDHHKQMYSKLIVPVAIGNEIHMHIVEG